MKNFKLVNQFLGYRNKTDKTNLGDGYLVSGSQNVVSDDGDRIAIRKGYTLDGTANSTNYPIVSSYEWQTHSGNEIPLRSWNDKLQIRYANDWIDLETGFTSVNFNFTEFWDTVNQQDLLLFVNGTPNIYNWTGGIATFASATANTITKQGATTWGEERFAVTGSIVINGNVFTYTGGIGTTTLTGVAPDPTTFGFAVGTPVLQKVVTTTNTPSAGFNNSIIKTLENQVWVGDLKKRDIYKSKVNSFTDYSFGSPRKVGEGALLTLDSSPVGFEVQEETIYISGSASDWYKADFKLSSDLQDETIFIKRLKTAPQSGAKVQSAIAKIKNDVVFISNEPTLDNLGRVENIDTPQSRPISDPIKIDFDAYDFTNAHIKYFRNNLYIALPAENILLIFNIVKQYWEAPQILPVRRLAIINNELYIHSNSVPETYKMFDGYNDNGNPIDARALFSYQNYGRRDWQKNFTEFYTEGYIQPNTILTCTLFYDYDGYGQIQSFEINGNDDGILFKSSDDGSLGKHSLGKYSLGGVGSPTDETLPPKFRVINTNPKFDFYELQVQYSSYEVDQRWELLAFGPNAELSTGDNNIIKR